MRHSLVAAAIAASALLALPATAAPIYPLDQIVPTTADFRQGGGSPDSARSYRFRAQADGIRVTQLGVLLPEDQQVTLSLFDVASQTVIAQTELGYTGATEGDDDPNNDSWQFVDLTAAVSLVNGAEYLVSVYADDLIYWFNLFADTTTGVPDGVIDYLGMNYCNFCSGANAFPTQRIDGSLYGLVDFGYEIAAVPAPAALSLFGLGLFGLATRRRG